ncbi:hypothetical protein L914_21418 [Phytophthora nicotianae]|uniref:Uncharacterized protein n=1 Tax=Phytophthora nicotianae TaxID=4792 RepID=W2M3P7_PHYNI|nr:hypothetical protein L914_21418 [Phytophthora nicotianae]
MDELKKFESVSKNLQEKNGLTLRHVRVMFDKLISVFPVSCERHLSHNARIVALPNFENGVTKILCGPESDLTPSERAAVRPLMRSNEVINTEPSDEELVFAEAAPATLIFQPLSRAT